MTEAVAALPAVAIDGIAKLHALIARHGGEGLEPGQVAVGIETECGPWVQAQIAAGYRIYAVNPRQAGRLKERCSTSGAKSYKGDAHVLAGMVRIDGARLRPIARDGEQAPSPTCAPAPRSPWWRRCV